MLYIQQTLKKYPLKEKRTKAGLSLRQLEAISGISYSYIAKLEKEAFVAQEATYKKLKEAIVEHNKSKRYKK